MLLARGSWRILRFSFNKDDFPFMLFMQLAEGAEGQAIMLFNLFICHNPAYVICVVYNFHGRPFHGSFLITLHVYACVLGQQRLK